MKLRKALLACLIWAVIAAGCVPAGVPARQATGAGSLRLPPGYGADVAVEGLQAPTQMTRGPQGRLWVAQMAGDENAGTGQVMVIDVESGERNVVVEGLLKPTGIALLDGDLWIATKRELLRASLELVDEEGVAGSVEAVLSDLPFDGRSNGTLTITPERMLVFETSGARFGGEPTAGSATLWRLDPAKPEEPEALATGLKSAYGHAFDAAGRLWVTEIGADLVNGVAPPDELNLAAAGADFGWPQCYAAQQPALNYGGTQVRCLGTRSPVALFAPHAAPTSVVASPWEPDTLLVALRGKGEIARVRAVYAGDNAQGEVETFVSGLIRPQHLLAWDEDSLLVSDQATGRVYRIYPAQIAPGDETTGTD